MVEKLIDLFKLFLEKFLYESVISLFATLLTVFFLPDDSMFYDKWSSLEARVCFFTFYFIMLRVIKFLVIFVRTRWIAYIDSKKIREKEAIQIQKGIEEKALSDQEALRGIKKLIVELPACDKKILKDFIDNKNKPIEIENRTYDGDLLTVYGDYVEVIKRYSKPMEINKNSNTNGIIFNYNLEDDYTQFKLSELFYESIKYIYFKEGSSYFEWN